MAGLEKLPSLLNERYFPDDADISEKRILLEAAIQGWIIEKGTPCCDKRPLQYGEPFIFCMPSMDGSLMPGAIVEGKPGSPPAIGINIPPSSRHIAMPTLECADGQRDGGTVLVGDHLRVRLKGTSYL
jgi:hypothetical protein